LARAAIKTRTLHIAHSISLHQHKWFAFAGVWHRAFATARRGMAASFCAIVASETDLMASAWKIDADMISSIARIHISTANVDGIKHQNGT